MIDTLSIQCTKCKHPMTLRVNSIITLRKRVMMLEALLRKNNILYHDPTFPETYGKYVNLFIDGEIISTQDSCVVNKEA